MNRALRRFYRQRWKNRVEKRLKSLRWRWSMTDPSERTIGIGAKTRKFCSSRCCGNQRKYEGRSIQEHKDYLDYLSQLEDL